MSAKHHSNAPHRASSHKPSSHHMVSLAHQTPQSPSVHVAIKPAPPPRKGVKGVKPLLKQPLIKQTVVKNPAKTHNCRLQLFGAALVLAIAGVVIGTLAGLGVLTSSSSTTTPPGTTGTHATSSSTGEFIQGSTLAPVFLMNVVTTGVAPGSIVPTDMSDGACNDYTFNIPVAIELGTKTQPFIQGTNAIVAYQQGRVYSAQRIVPTDVYGDEVNVGSGAMTLNAWLYYGFHDVDADYIAMGSNSPNYDGPIMLLGHATGWCLSDNTNRVDCPGATCTNPPGFVCTSLAYAPISVWNMITMTYSPSGANSVYSIYVNGSAVSTVVAPAHTMAWDSGISLFDVDTSGTGGVSYPGWDGSLYQAAVWYSALLPSQIAAIYAVADLGSLFTC